MAKIYQLKGYGDDFHTGLAGDDRQVLMGLLCPHLVAYFFSPEGELLGREMRPWDYPAPGGEGRGYDIYNKDFRRHLAQQFALWRREIGFQPGRVQVQMFFDDQQYVGVEDLPEHYQNLELWEDEDERHLVEQERRDWIEQGQFVFWWAKDYYMAADGEVDST